MVYSAKCVTAPPPARSSWSSSFSPHPHPPEAVRFQQLWLFSASVFGYGYSESSFKPHEKASILNLNKNALILKSWVIVKLKKAFVKCLEMLQPNSSSTIWDNSCRTTVRTIFIIILNSPYPHPPESVRFPQLSHHPPADGHIQIDP